MAGIPFTLRIDVAERVRSVKNLSKIEGRPINQLLNEAIKNSFPIGRARRNAVWNPPWRALKNIGRRMPVFARAIAEFAEGEASLADPL